jgi:2-C-methyl-D-erythritol 2,4-cyclodiphosphate synthase
MVWERGFKVINADLVVMAEEPKIQPYKEAMVEKISGLLNIDKNYVGVKATTCEGLGAIGRGEGIFSQAVILLEKVHGK